MKLIVSNLNSRVVATVTGTGTILAAPSRPVPFAEVCGYLPKATRLLDSEHIVRSLMPELDSADPAKLVAPTIQAVRGVRVAAPNALRPYSGREMFQVILATYDPHTVTSSVRGFTVSLTPDADPFVSKQFDMSKSSAESRDYWAFGETDYFNQEVIGGIGLSFLSPTTRVFLKQPREIKDVTIDDAALVAADLIKSTERVTGFIPAPSGIGGAVRLVVIDDQGLHRLSDH